MDNDVLKSYLNLNDEQALALFRDLVIAQNYSAAIICTTCFVEMLDLSSVFPVHLTVRLLSHPLFRK